MLPPAHLLSGYVVLLGLVAAGTVDATAVALVLAGVLALLPDIDMLWAETVAGHHDAVTHTPAFWFGAGLVLFLIPAAPRWLAVLVTAETVFHLFADYVTGRTTGVMLFYPFSRDAYSLFPVDPERGAFDLFAGREQIQDYLMFYVENRAVAGVEAGIAVIGAAALVVLL